MHVRLTRIPFREFNMGRPYIKSIFISSTSHHILTQMNPRYIPKILFCNFDILYYCQSIICRLEAVWASVHETSSRKTVWNIQYIPRNMHTVLLCFALLWLCNRSLWIHMKYSSIFIRVAVLALGQSLDCHSASEVSLMDMGKSVNV